MTFGERVICKLTITPTHKMAAPMWTQDGRHKMAAGQGSCGQLGGTRPAGRAVGGDQASREGSFRGRTRPAGEGSWGGDQDSRGEQLGGPGLQGRAVGGDQACRGGQLGGDQACRGGQFRPPAEESSWGDQAIRRGQLGAVQGRAGR